MTFKMKYRIISDYITKPSKRRSGILMSKVGFVVAHDTGNKNSTAKNNVDYFKRSKNEMSASAHIFVDDKQIIECVPLLTGTPEKAWHVWYDKPLDNQMYGDDANDIAAGVEYCFGDNINANEAYKRYIWVMAYICYKYNLNPSKDIVGHMILDPQRKTDPQNGLKQSGRSYEQMLEDVVKEYNDCLVQELPSIQREIGVQVNGVKAENAYLINNTSYVPVRFVSEQFGATVGFDGKNVIINKGMEK
ncbi:N-acetylmuramoyl-L-alanine amidase [Paenibacillus alkalitolerans]|uniref:N-acetylmuramoyl-L-alanine amidase n=1 Tax=Paenibacillus alkalitolerans TaxID=2799335 RepID=UPI0018F6513B|nr:N-acetylmuramoyl-L-alanine amidase [Paenibacillus alkalitolerans]